VNSNSLRARESFICDSAVDRGGEDAAGPVDVRALATIAEISTLVCPNFRSIVESSVLDV
ncbi:MAG TPA: hypothetical protein VMH39_07730, partial [Gemmatimonadaceae bacterium]|nr:hypothetical protein [Gemmatimonadaceae bacterium]